MKNKILLTAAFGCAALAFTACGDEVTEQIVQSNSGLESVAAIDELPECTSENAGTMAFVSDSAKVYYCADSSWQLLNGKDGIDGTNGTDGKDGVDGVNGADGKPGQNGTDGESCTVEKLKDKDGYKVVCGGDSVGVVLNGTNGSDETGSDENEFLYYCGGIVYNPTTHFCKYDQIFALCNDGKLYEPKTEFCTETGELLSKCGGSIYDPSAGEECREGVIFAPCGGFMASIAAEHCDPDATYIQDSRDGKLYKIVTIGTQVWTAENMNYASSGSYCHGEDANCEKYGRLYRWEAAKSACPAGYHLPSDAEWEVLLKFVTADNNLSLTINGQGTTNKAATYLKSKTGWIAKEGIPAGNGKYGFNSLPAGGSFYEGNSDGIGYYSASWSSTEYDESSAYYYAMFRDSEHFGSHAYGKTVARSVRCLKD